MTRIISGFADSLTIAVPSAGTRPTSDRVREAIFSALDARGVLPGASVVDLYAGSGALGLEAASRGASHVTLVERGSAAANVCRRNAALLKARAPKGGYLRIEVSSQSVNTFLRTSTAQWDLAMIDPPYELDEAELARELSLLAPRLAEGAVVLIERSSRSPEPSWPAGVELDKRRNYGDTTLWWAGKI
ncbi:MAG: rsmD [Homoserinimonas sp.]|jgi:16S rRNA (guanine966-N2)-methyltransferase|nr:rsmD [Homoserinimonas sp.]